MKFLLNAFLVLSVVTVWTQSTDIKEYKDGLFRYQNRSLNTVVLIKGHYRIDYDLQTKQWMTLKSNWDSDSTCTYTFVNTNMESVKKYLGKSIHTEVSEPLENGYAYLAQLQNSSKKYRYEMVQLDRVLTKNEEKRIVETLKYSKHSH